MEVMILTYKISEIAKLSGVSSRTLRYYDTLNVLSPSEIDDNGYRVYTDAEVDKLQMILLYRDMGVKLDEIGALLSADNFDRLIALESHLKALVERKVALDKMITNLTKTIHSIKGGCTMSDREKFEGLNILAENETRYGEELRGKYGEEVVNQSFQKMQKVLPEDIEKATLAMNTSLLEAFKTGDPSSLEAQRACECHKHLLEITWPEGMVTKNAQLALVEGFLDDQRFVDYYEGLQKGMMHFFYEATKIYCETK